MGDDSPVRKTKFGDSEAEGNDDGHQVNEEQEKADTGQECSTIGCELGDDQARTNRGNEGRP